ncbi:carboxyvinyl-carboxyphosphonate phosphorylmutase, partial [Streptomyces sp. NPDC014006]
RAERLAATDADVVLVDGVRSVEWIRRIREVVGGKPLLFNQIAGGKSPRMSLSELSGLGVDVAIYSTPCLFAAHEAMDSALAGLKEADGRLPEVDAANGVGVKAATRLLERNIARLRTTPTAEQTVAEAEAAVEQAAAAQAESEGVPA